MMSGSPPTERNARTGLLTPPTRSFEARSKISRERRRSRCRVGRVADIAMVLYIVPTWGAAPRRPATECAQFRGGLSALIEPAGGLLGVVSEEDGSASALNAGQDFKDYV